MVLLAFAVAMAVAIMLSSLMHRTVLSSTALFFAAGIAVGPDVLDLFRELDEEPLGLGDDPEPADEPASTGR